MNLADIPNPLAAVVCHLFSVCLLLCIAVLEDEELLVNAAPMMSLQQSGSASAAATSTFVQQQKGINSGGRTTFSSRTRPPAAAVFFATTNNNLPDSCSTEGICRHSSLKSPRKMKDTFSLVTPRASSTSSTPWSSPLSPAEEEESGPSPTPEKSFHLKAAGDAAAAAVARVFFFEAGSGWGENLAEANVQQEWEKSLRQLCTKAAVAAGRAAASAAVKAYRGEELEYPDPGEDGSSGTYRDLTETKVAEFATKWVAYQIDGALSQWKLLAPQFDFNTDERLQHMLAKAAADAAVAAVLEASYRRSMKGQSPDGGEGMSRVECC